MNVSLWIERWAAFRPERPAILREDGSALSYGALRAQTRRTSALLRDGLGLGRGDRVAFLGLNSPAMLALLFACARIGAILVPLNWRLAPPEHRFVLDHCGASALFCESGFGEVAEEFRARGGRCIAVDGDDGAPGSAAASGAVPDPESDPDAPLLIVYTSGTTGRPRGAVLDHRAVAFSAANAIAMHDLTSADTVLTNLPICHVGGLNIQTLPALQAGATVILHRRFDAGVTIRAIRERRPTLALMVPAMMAAVAERPEWKGLDLSSLRALATGGSALPLPLLDAWLERGVPVIQSFGTTETASLVLHQRAAEAWTRRGSVGRPALHCEVRIAVPDGAAAGPGTKGEILVRGPGVMRGYWNDAPATAEVLKDGWYRTGDVGHFDDDGSWHVDDRLRDVIVSGSANVYPRELETVLEACPAIAEAAVIGRPDDRWGEVPVAVVAAAAAIRREDVLALFAGRLARYKRPRDVVFVDRLPRNATGKILKDDLRKRFGGAA